MSDFKIKVIDQFLQKEDQEKIFNIISKSKNWSFTGGGDGDYFWHVDEFEKDTYFSQYIFSKVEKYINKKCEILRVYANGQTAGQNGCPHLDNVDDKAITFLYYPNPNWDVRWQGHLHFLDSNEIVRTINYKSNRAVMFNGNIMHYAEAPHRCYNYLRISLAYKLSII